MRKPTITHDQMMKTIEQLTKMLGMLAESYDVHEREGWNGERMDAVQEHINKTVDALYDVRRHFLN